MTRRLSAREKQGRKPALRACTFCHSKHLQCSNTRPCLNCTKRKIEHECRDVVRKRALYLTPLGGEKRQKSGKKDRAKSASSETGFADSSSGENACYEPIVTMKHEDEATPDLRPDLRTELATEFAPAMAFSAPEDNLVSAATPLESFHHQTRDTQASTLSATADFNSMFLNQEYMMLGDLISKPSSPSALEFAAAVPDPLMGTNPDFFGNLDADDGIDTRPYISLGDGEEGMKSAKESGFNFDLRAHDGHVYVSPLLSHHIYQTVQDIYSNRIIDFDYPLSYHSLTHFLKSRFSEPASGPDAKSRKRSNLLVILKLIASYRPTFISTHKSLFQPFDFQFLEMSFQRCLLDFENLSRLNASPMIIWRRTGEIVSMSAHLANILGLDISDVLSKRTFIMELMYDDESIVEYFRLFKSVAIGSLHLTIFTKCKLLKKPSQHKWTTSRTNARLSDVEYIEFSSVWTVKRDIFDLPMMIVGHFLPSLPNNDAVRS